MRPLHVRTQQTPKTALPGSGTASGPARRSAGRGQQSEIGQVAQGQFGAGGGIDDEQSHRRGAGVQGGMIAAGGHVDRAAGADRLDHRGAVVILDHLLARAFQHQNDLFGAGVIVAAVAAAGGEGDDAAGECCRAIDLGADGQGKLAPVEPEGVRETYVVPTIDGSSRMFTESPTYQWLASQGNYSSGSTGGTRDAFGNPAPLFTDWRAPAADDIEGTTDIELWFIQRDERLGVHWYESCIRVVP